MLAFKSRKRAFVSDCTQPFHCFVSHCSASLHTGIGCRIKRTGIDSNPPSIHGTVLQIFTPLAFAALSAVHTVIPLTDLLHRCFEIQMTPFHTLKAIIFRQVCKTLTHCSIIKFPPACITRDPQNFQSAMYCSYVISSLRASFSIVSPVSCFIRNKYSNTISLSLRLVDKQNLILLVLIGNIFSGQHL